VLTLNVPEVLSWDSATFRYPLTIVKNTIPKGYGANHNAVFRLSQCKYFCVLNPDIRLCENPFPMLITLLDNSEVGLTAPAITDASGRFEDNARRFPTPMLIVAKALGRLPKIDYDMRAALIYPDWVAGMFMVFSSTAFQLAKGFDERYFLYYEDVDLCARLHMMGYNIVMCPSVRVIHDARRHSHRNLRHLRWHIGSMLSFFVSRPFFKLVMRGGNAPKARQHR
jgi:GT2 family glycosyltransferase